MPRLPTIRVIGSHDISTSFLDSVGVSVRGAVRVVMVFSFPGAVGLPAAVIGGGTVSGGQLGTRVAPPRLLVDGAVGEGAQGADGPAVDADGHGRQGGPGRLVHEGHELVREARHGTGD